MIKLKCEFVTVAAVADGYGIGWYALDSLSSQRINTLELYLKRKFKLEIPKKLETDSNEMID